MLVGGTRLIVVVGASLLAMAVWAWYRPTLGQDALAPLPGSSFRTPAAGLLLTERATLYVDLLGEAPAFVPEDAGSYFSDDWAAVSLATVARIEGALQTTITLPSGKTVALPGAHWLHTCTRDKVVAVAEAPGADGLFALRAYDAAGGTRFELAAAEPEWLGSSASGRILAVGTRAGTRVHGDDGQEVCELAGSSDLGAVSERHVAIQREAAGGLELVVRALTAGAPEHAMPVRRGSSLRFDQPGTTLAHVSPTEVLVLDLGAAEAQILQRRPAAPDHPWRDAAFDRQGNLAASWIQVEQEPTFETEESERPGKALVGVEVFSLRPLPDAVPPLPRIWQVYDWSACDPRLNFDELGQLYAIVWPHAFQVLP